MKIIHIIIITFLLFSCNRTNNQTNQTIITLSDSIVLYQNIFDEDELSAIINEFEIYSSNIFNDISWENLDIVFTLNFPGTTLPAGEMLFLSNSIMILRWIFTEDFELYGNRFYKYLLNNNELSLISIDHRHDIISQFYVGIDQGTLDRDNVLLVDDDNKKIIYNFNGSVSFGGWIFR